MQSDPEGMILMYCPSLDRFLAVGQVEARDIAPKLSASPSREEYIQAVVRACVPTFNRDIAPHGDALMATGDPLGAVHLEEEIFDLCRQVNPHLDLTQVSLPQGLSEERQNSPDSIQLKNLGEFLSKRVIGQVDAISTVCQALRRSFCGLATGDRPLASFLFAGTTGVGKTELAKALTEGLWKDASKLIRLDGSEYALPHEAAKLIGAPPGYVGHEQGGQLTSRARELGSGILLIDEIEKADSKVHSLLLQLLDEGRLTDSHGVTVDFTQFVVILTTNTGARDMEARRRAPGFGRDGLALDDKLRTSTTLEALLDEFSPEFLNRLDHKIVFKELGREDCRHIVDGQLTSLVERSRQLGVSLDISEAVRTSLVDLAWDPRWGAREIRRHIVTRLETPLADWLIESDLKPGSLRVDIKDDNIILVPTGIAA